MTTEEIQKTIVNAIYADKNGTHFSGHDVQDLRHAIDELAKIYDRLLSSYLAETRSEMKGDN